MRSVCLDIKSGRGKRLCIQLKHTKPAIGATIITRWNGVYAAGPDEQMTSSQWVLANRFNLRQSFVRVLLNYHIVLPVKWMLLLLRHKSID